MSDDDESDSSLDDYIANNPKKPKNSNKNSKVPEKNEKKKKNKKKGKNQKKSPEKKLEENLNNNNNNENSPKMSNKQNLIDISMMSSKKNIENEKKENNMTLTEPIQIYHYQPTFNIDNVFLLNSKFKIPVHEPCLYILNQNIPTISYTPITTRKVKELYISNQLNEEFTQFRPFDLLKFKNLNNYTFVNFKLINENDWVDNIEVNTKMGFLYERKKEEKIQKDDALIFSESFIQKMDDESIAIFNEKASKAIIEEQKKGLEIINESGEWLVVDKGKKKKMHLYQQEKKLLKERGKEMGKQIIGLEPKKVNKKNNSQKEDILDLLNPNKNKQAPNQYSKFITAFGQKFEI